MPDYEQALEILRQRYLARLHNSVEAIDNILAQRQLSLLSKNDVRRAHSLAHGLSGSGTIFGFPEITEAGQIADRMLSDLAASMPDNGTLTDLEFKEIEKVLLALRTACQAVAAEEKVQPDNKKTPVISAHTPHLHIIEDDPELSEMLALELERDKFAVTISADGETALRAIRKQAPDLIILDISLPQMSGHEVLQSLKQDPEFIRIPILILTGRDDRIDFIKALHAGALDYLVKPFDLQKLRARVRKILKAS